jgi:hypothetical protein
VGKHGPDRAYQLLTYYDQLNSDLPPRVRRMLGLWYAGPRVGLKALKQVVDYKLSTAPVSQHSFLYWNAFLIAGCPEVWDDFAMIKNAKDGTIRKAMKDVKKLITPEQWAKVCRVLGYEYPPKFRAFSPTLSTNTVWTRGGVWDKRSSFTKIILFGEHIPRSYAFNTWSWKMGEEGARRLELELYRDINPELYVRSECYKKATEYVRLRVPQILGYVNMRAGYPFASWFFQTLVLNEKGFAYHYGSPKHRPRIRTTKEGHKIRWTFP